MEPRFQSTSISIIPTMNTFQNMGVVHRHLAQWYRYWWMNYGELPANRGLRCEEALCAWIALFLLHACQQLEQMLLLSPTPRRSARNLAVEEADAYTSDKNHAAKRIRKLPVEKKTYICKWWKKTYTICDPFSDAVWNSKFQSSCYQCQVNALVNNK